MEWKTEYLEIKRTLWGKAFYWLQKVNLQRLLKGKPLANIFVDGVFSNAVGVDKNLNVIEL